MMYEEFSADDARLVHPFSMLLSGNRRTGKTQFIKNVLIERERIITPHIEHVVWFYAAEQPDVFDELRKRMGSAITFVKGLPKNSNISETFLMERYGTKLVVIDDLMSEANQREDVNHLFTRGRHENTSVFFLTQNLFNKGRYMRENSLNADYVVLFKNPRDSSTVAHLGRQMGKTRFINDAFQQATKDKPFTYLLLDLRSDTKEELRVRYDILDKYPGFFVERV
jgi:hypothetical protein